MRKIWMIFICFMLLHCSDDEAQKKQGCKLVLQRYADLVYDGKGRLSTLIQLSGNGEPTPDGHRREFKYNTKNKLTLINDFEGVTLNRKFTFNYSKGLIIQKEYWFPGDGDDESVDYTITYALNSEGKVIRLDHESGSLDEPFNQVYEYENGNVIKITRDSENGIGDYVLEYEFDTYQNVNAIEGFEIYFGDVIYGNFTQNKNNYTKITRQNGDAEPMISTYSYSYDSNGYPTERFTNGVSTPSWFYEYEDCD